MVQIHVTAGDKSAGRVPGRAALAAALKGRRIGRWKGCKQGQVAGTQERGCHHSRLAQWDDSASQDEDGWIVCQFSLHTVSRQLWCSTALVAGCASARLLRENYDA